MLAVALAARAHACAPQQGGAEAGAPPASTAARLEQPTIAAVRTGGPPVIDGRMDDACWADAPMFSEFTQVLPVEGGVASERTEVRVLFDADNLYLAVR